MPSFTALGAMSFVSGFSEAAVDLSMVDR